MKISGTLVTKFRTKVAVLLAFRYSIRYFIFVGFLLGVVLLVVRVLFNVNRQLLLWGLLSFVPGIVWAVLSAIKRIPSRQAVCTVFDEHSKCGGLLMAAQETDIGSWGDKVPDIVEPDIKWKCGQNLVIFVAAMMFVIIGFIMPDRLVKVTIARQMDVTHDVEQLQQQIETLQEEHIISQESAKELEQKLNDLKENQSAYDPVKTWESLDHLKQTMKKQVDKAADTTIQQSQELAKAETLSKALAESSQDLDSSLLAEAMAQLSNMVKQNSETNKLLDDMLSQDFKADCELGQLSAEQLAQLAKNFKECKMNLSKCMGRLCKAGLIDPEMLKACEAAGMCNDEDLIAFLNGNCNKMGMCEALDAFCQGSCPGRGGISRGRGDAPMFFGDQSSDDRTEFKEQILPPASLQALKDSIMTGVSLGAPTLEQADTTSSANVLGSASAGGGEAVTHKILPRHKNTVKKYFERK